MTVELYGYKYGVYAWIARLVLREKGVRCDWREAEPFEGVPVAQWWAAMSERAAFKETMPESPSQPVR